MSTPHSELLNGMSSLFSSGRYSDMTIVCRSHKYPVHKAVLCSRSHFFEGACNGHFSESQKGQIDLSEEDEEAVEHMIHYFYFLDYLVPEDAEGQTTDDSLRATTRKTGRFNLQDVEDPLIATASAVCNDYQPTSPPQPPADVVKSAKPSSPRPPSPRTRRYSRLRRDSVGVPSSGAPDFPNHSNRDGPAEEELDDTPDLLVHARVYALAEKYGVQGLKTLACNKFERLAAHRWAEPDFLEAAEEVYTSTIESDRDLRNVVLQSFRQRPELARRSDVQDTVQHIPPLAFDLYRMSWGVPMAS